MKLQNGPLVQWQDGEVWHTGCLLVNQHGDMLTMYRGCVALDHAQDNRLDAVVKHGFTGELETVDASLLTIRPNEHPE